MSVFSAVRDSIAKHATLTKTIVTILGLGLIAGIVLDYGLGTPTSESNVVADWNETIKTLGIEPVFPPEEDLYVGDILAVIVDDENPTQIKAKNRALLNRAIKLAHLNLHDELVKTYGELPFFSSGPVKNKDVKQVEATPEPQKIEATAESQKQSVPEVEIFDVPNKRIALPLAAFPGFSIHHRSAASVIGFLKAQFSVRQYQDDDVELTIPFVETYGIPSVTATKILNKFCVENAEICNDAVLRKQLSFVSPAVFEKDAAALRDRNELRYYANIDLELVNRVYLATSIEEHRGRGSGRSASVYSPGSGLIPTSPVPNKPSTDGEAAGRSSGPDVAKTPPAPHEGVDAVSARSVSEDKSELKQVFDRPIVIGYRAVKKGIEQNFNQQAVTPGQK
jgi:hypothetical protein